MLIQKLYTNVSISITVIAQVGKNMNVHQLMNDIVALDGRRAELAVVSRLRSRIRRAGKVTRETAETWRQKAAKWSAEIWAQGVKADAERRRTQEHVER